MMLKKCFTIETRLKTEQMPLLYFEQDIEKQSRLFRIVWNLIQEKKYTQSQLNTYLQKTYQIDKRTANTLIQGVKGRLQALKELKALEKELLQTKCIVLKQQIEDIKKELDVLKEKVIQHCVREKELEKYRHLKQHLWQKKQKYNRMEQSIKQYKRQEQIGYYPICWGGKRLFRAQYYLKENGFRSHEGWLHAYRKKRDGQLNFIGSSEEPMGNQNCQLRYDKETDSFWLRIRKDLEYMTDKKDKFFCIEGLQFRHHREKLIETIEQRDTPFTFRFLRRGKKWYVQVIFTWKKENEEIGRKINGVIGIDFNEGFLSVSETDRYGNLIEIRNILLSKHGMGRKADSELQKVVAKIVETAKEKGKAISIEDLNFSKKKAKCKKGKGNQGKSYHKMLHTLDYGRYRKRMENACFRKEVELLVVNPAYTTKIGIEKYAKRMKLNRHQAASYVIARKGQGYKDKIRLANG